MRRELKSNKKRTREERRKESEKEIGPRDLKKITR